VLLERVRGVRGLVDGLSARAGRSVTVGGPVLVRVLRVRGCGASDTRCSLPSNTVRQCRSAPAPS
jgi:hypothetical protein